MSTTNELSNEKAYMLLDGTLKILKKPSEDQKLQILWEKT